MNLFQRASAGLSLTPGERAALKLLQNLLWVALVAALGVAQPLIASGAFVLNQTTLVAVGGAALVALLNAVAKLVSAKGDGVLAGAVGMLASDVLAHLPSQPLHQQSAAVAPAPVSQPNADASAI